MKTTVNLVRRVIRAIRVTKVTKVIYYPKVVSERIRVTQLDIYQGYIIKFVINITYY